MSVRWIMLYVIEWSVVNVTSIDGISLEHMYTHVLLFAEFVLCCYTLFQDLWHAKYDALVFNVKNTLISWYG